MDEATWQAQVLELAGLSGWTHFHPYNMRRSDPGWPDLVLCRPPELIFVELKTDRGRVRPEQTVWLERLEACGAEVYIWRPRDFDEVHQRLRRRTCIPAKVST